MAPSSSTTMKGRLDEGLDKLLELLDEELELELLDEELELLELEKTRIILNNVVFNIMASLKKNEKKFRDGEIFFLRCRV